jgi:polyketide synthase PksN
LFAHTNGEVRFTIVSVQQEQAETVYAQGKLHYAKAVQETGEEHDAFDLEAIKARCQPLMDHEALYAMLAENGFTPGPCFRQVQNLSGNGKEVLSEIVLATPLLATADDYVLHPVLMDGALQTAAAGLFQATGAIPLLAAFSIGRIEILKSLPPRCYVYATRVEDSTLGNALHLFNMALLDDNGDALVRIHEFAVREFQPHAIGVTNTQVSTEGSHQTGSRSDRVSEAWQQQLSQDLFAIAATVVKTTPDKLDSHEDLRYYGFESISFVELTHHINDRYDLNLTPAVFFEYGTLGGFISFLQQKYGDSLHHHYQKHRVPKTGVLSPDHLGNVDQPDVALGRRFFTSNADVPATVRQAESVAIIGMAGKLPQSEDLSAFWQHLASGTDLITEIPGERWNWRQYDGDPETQADKTFAKWGGFMPDVGSFDPRFFGLSPREAELMDPQHRLFLECAWQTIEHAGYCVDDLSGSRTGVFVGVATNDYNELLQSHGVPAEGYMATGNVHSMIANRVSFLMNFIGPSVAVDTACSSSLIAIQRAVKALQNGDCELAIAGGVNAILSPRLGLTLSNAGMLSREGRCKTFAADADGYVRGEGVGAILLKPLAQAEADGDHILAIIRGCAENHGGHATSLTAPNPASQANVIVDAWQKTGVDPETITYIEAHGTGTKLGDPIEIEGLKTAFAQLYKNQGKVLPMQPHCGLGSAKSFIGHLEASAGIAGVLKVLLSMQHQTLPANLHCQTLNPYIQLQGSPFYVIQENQYWATPVIDGQAVPRRAGISAFGFGGVNAHVVLEQYTTPLPNEQGSPHPVVILLSARTSDQLIVMARRLLNFVQHNPQESLASMAYTLQVGRKTMSERLALVSTSLSELAMQLAAWLDQKHGSVFFPAIYQGHYKATGDSPTAASARLYEDLALLAQQWVSKNLAVDWSSLYQQKPKRMALPSYPFARRYYWFAAGEKTLAYSHEDKLSSLHPLLDTNVSTLEAQCFQKHLTAQDFYLRDHKINGVAILPGVAYLEMARAAADFSYKGLSFNVLENVVWSRPICVEASQTVKTTISLYPNSATQLEFEISTGDNSAMGGKLHAQGQVLFDDALVLPKPVDITAIKIACVLGQSGEDFYQQYEADGFDYGNSFRIINNICRDADSGKALAQLLLPNEVQANVKSFVLHPAIMDSALQTVRILLPANLDGIHYLPFSLARLNLFAHDLSAIAYVYACNIPSDSLNDQNAAVKKYDIKLVDVKGGVLAEINTFIVKSATRQAKHEPATIDNNLLDKLYLLADGQVNIQHILAEIFK